MMKEPPPANPERMVALDGLRGLAVLFVAFHHFGLHLPSWLDWGPVAPNIFFLLSGYLITRSLLKMRADPSPGQLFRYHARRLTRLLPALYAMLAVGCLVGLAEYREGVLWHAAFLSNIQMVVNDEWAGYASHLWSLSNQEQFYLLWPLILFLPARWLLHALLATFAGAAIFRLWCLHAGTSEIFRWLVLPSSLDTFAAGGLIAWIAATRKGAPLLSSRWRWPAAFAALACWFLARALRGGYGINNPGLAFIDTFETVFFAWLLIELMQNPGSLLARAFSFRPLCHVGRISYGIYLWHLLVFLAIAPWLDATGWASHPWLRCGALTLASIAVAQFSWIVLEKPFIEWGRRLTAPEGLLVTWQARAAKWLGRVENA